MEHFRALFATPQEQLSIKMCVDIFALRSKLFRLALRD